MSPSFDPGPADVEFTCPRCGEAAVARLYGPCPACSDQLQAKFTAEAKDVEVAEYEPKMNVTPNAVATKE
jgi:ssDNA-binding Zn-finger/Zn-ribbon topoisomerase 1